MRVADRPFDASDCTAAGPEWGRKFVLACRAHTLNQEQQNAILFHATDGRTAILRAIRCDEVLAVRATWKRVIAGLASPPADRSLVFEITKKKTKTVPAKYVLVGVVIAGAAHVELVKQAFPGTKVA